MSPAMTNPTRTATRREEVMPGVCSGVFRAYLGRLEVC